MSKSLTIPCPGCKGSGKPPGELQESMGSRACCGLCQGKGHIPNNITQFNESVQAGANPNRLTS